MSSLSLFNRIKSFYVNNSWIDVIIFIIITILTSMFISNHITSILIDHGREFQIPAEMLNGKILYKDITLIYFPLAYYVNAFIFKILGVSINSLLISQTFFSCVFVTGYYYLSREFLSRKLSFSTVLLVIFCVVFCRSDLFNYITPYAYAATYGMFTFVFCLLSIVKLFKTDKIFYAYIAALLSGLAFSFKIEFYVAFLLLIISLFFYKKLKISQYLKMLFLFFIFPLITLSLLLINSVTLENLYDAAIFGYKFSKTPAMFLFLKKGGMFFPPYIPTLLFRIKDIFPKILTIILLCFFTLKLNQRYKKFYIIPLCTIFICYFYFQPFACQTYWFILPVVFLVLVLIHCKDLLKNWDKEILILVIAAFFISQRSFWSYTFYAYGTFAFPTLFLGFLAILQKILPEYIYSVKTKHILYYTFFILTIIYISGNVFHKYSKTIFPIDTNKGTIYVEYDQYPVLEDVIVYIQNNVDKNSTLLVLPEGNFINFVTDRKVDMHCFMMDRLYHDAYGEEKAKEIIKNTNSDYILLIENGDVGNFDYLYLYKDNHSLASTYIENNYESIKKFSGVKNYYGRTLEFNLLKKKE